MNEPNINTPAGAATTRNSEVASDVRLPRPPGVFRRWLAAHSRAVDWVIVGTYLFGCALMLTLQGIFGLVGEELAQIDPATGQSLQLDVNADELAVGVDSAKLLTGPWLIVNLLSIALIAAALRFRRRYPLAGLIVIAVLAFFEQGLLVFPNSVALVFLLYAVPVYRSVTAGWIGYGVVTALTTVSYFLSDDSSTGLLGPSGLNLGNSLNLRDSIAISVITALWFLAILMIAINLGNRRRYVQALIDRAHQLATEREQRAQLAVAAERSRIAREMHDIVAHSLSVVVTLAEAASVAVDSQPAAAKKAMEQASDTGRTALVEMRRLLGVLNEDGYGAEVSHTGGDAAGLADAGNGGSRDSSEVSAGIAAPRAPQPGVAQLPELIESFRNAGLEVAVTQEGVPHGDRSQQLAIYRIAQEGLTNALRYAGRGARVSLMVEHAPDHTRLEVSDSGRVRCVGGPDTRSGGEAHRAAAEIPGSGRGLAGAKERARMFGGTFEAGRRGSGWRLSAVIPTAAGAAPDHPTSPDQRDGRSGT